MQAPNAKKVGRPRKHSSDSAKTTASNKKWIDAGNRLTNVWIPASQEAKEKLKEFAVELRREYDTFLPEDLIL